MNKGNCSSDEVVCRDGLAVGAGARVEVERPSTTRGRRWGHAGRGEYGAVPGEESNVCILCILCIVHMYAMYTLHIMYTMYAT